MKKLVFTIFVISFVILGVNLGSAVDCYDSDGNNDPFVKGTITGNDDHTNQYVVKTDTC